MTVLSLPDAKVPEHHVQQVLDIHPAGNPANGADSQTEILGEKFRFRNLNGAGEGGGGFYKGVAVTGAGQDGRFASPG